MTVASVFLFMAGCFASPQAKATQLLFEAPKDATETDRKEAAKALAARCVAHGLAGVKGDVIHRGPDVPKQIRLLAPKPFTPAMVAAIDYLGSFLARDLELRFDRKLSAAEKEEFPIEEKAPKAHTWIRLRDWETLNAPFAHLEPSKQELCYLFPEKPGTKVAGQFTVHRHGGGDLYGEFNGPDVFLIFRDALVKTLLANTVQNPDDPDKTLIPIVLLLDGHRVPTENGHLLWRTLKSRSKNPDMALWKFPALAPNAALTYLLEHPLPFALKRIE